MVTKKNPYSLKSGATLEGLSPEVLNALAGAPSPFTITSGYRSPERNRAVGGVPGSYHTKGGAFDVRLGDVTPELIEYFKGQGFSPLRESDHYHFQRGGRLQGAQKMTGLGEGGLLGLQQGSEDPSAKDRLIEMLQKQANPETSGKEKFVNILNALAAGAYSVNSPEQAKMYSDRIINKKKNQQEALAQLYKLEQGPEQTSGMREYYLDEQQRRNAGLPSRTFGEYKRDISGYQDPFETIKKIKSLTTPKKSKVMDKASKTINLWGKGEDAIDTNIWGTKE